MNADALLGRLRSAAAHLAASAPEQVKYLEELGVAPSADELGLDFDDVAAAARAVLTSPQEVALARLDSILGRMSENKPGLWHTDALHNDPLWSQVREYAQKLLKELA